MDRIRLATGQSEFFVNVRLETQAPSASMAMIADSSVRPTSLNRAVGQDSPVIERQQQGSLKTPD